MWLPDSGKSANQPVRDRPREGVAPVAPSAL
jgi:hypothetical protein